MGQVSGAYNGGPAFPRAGFLGMSLRDYFAGQALSAIVRGFLQPADAACHAPGVAEDCVKLADALIAELRRTK